MQDQGFTLVCDVDVGAPWLKSVKYTQASWAFLSIRAAMEHLCEIHFYNI